MGSLRHQPDETDVRSVEDRILDTLTHMTKTVDEINSSFSSIIDFYCEKSGWSKSDILDNKHGQS
jgi:hypothetical protein